MYSCTVLYEYIHCLNEDDETSFKKPTLFGQMQCNSKNHNTGVKPKGGSSGHHAFQDTVYLIGPLYHII